MKPAQQPPVLAIAYVMAGIRNTFWGWPKAQREMLLRHLQEIHETLNRQEAEKEQPDEA